MLAAVVLVLRKPDAFGYPQFWAEDFNPFFIDARRFGPEVLFAPYNGYLHLLPRLIAGLAAGLHPIVQPAVYVGAAFALTLAVVALALSPRLDLPGRPWLALAVVVVPHTGEVFLNPTNVQWITALALLLTLLARDPASAADGATDAAVVVLAGLTGPFSVLLLPLFLARAWSRRTRASALIAAGVALTAAVQAWFLWHAPSSADPRPWNVAQLLGVVAVRLPMTLAMGEIWPVKLGYAVTTTLGLALAAAGIFLGVRPGRWRRERLVLLAALAVLLAAGIRRGRPDTWAFFDTFNGDRYFYPPKVIALWLVGLVVAEFSTRARRVAGGAVIAAALAANGRAFRVAPAPDLHWGLYAERIQAGERVEVPIHPGWKVVCPGRPAP